MGSAAVPLLGVALALGFWGSFVVPMKMSRAVREAQLATVWFQAYVGLGVLASSICFLVVPGVAEGFTPWGLVSGFMWVPGNFLAMSAVELLGLATAQATWAAAIVVVSFFWGVVLDGAPARLAPVAAGLVVLVIGVVIIAQASEGDSKGGGDTRGAAEGAVEYRPLAEDAATTAAAAADAGTRRSRGDALLGFACVAGVGALAGSIFVPLHFAPANLRDGFDGAFHFAFSQGIGIGLATFFWVPVILLAQCRRLPETLQQTTPALPQQGAGASRFFGAPPMHLRACIAPGMLSGLLWNCGNIGGTMATLQPLGQGVGYPMSQAAMLVSGAWGVFYFKEITGVRRVRKFWAGAATTFAGMCVAGVFAA
jgi:glucose uptake protein GlcU